MKHRHGGQYGVRPADAHGVGLQLPERVQDERAMGVGHPLGRPGRARGEAEPAGPGLVEAPPHAGRRAGDQWLERVRRPVSGRQVHDQNSPKAPRTLGHTAGEGRQVGAHNQHPGLGLDGHGGQLGLGETGVQRVAHRAHAHDGVPGLDMGLGVPGQGRDPLAGLHAQTGEGAGQPQAPVPQRRIADPVDPPVFPRRHHLSVGAPLGGVVQELVEGQGERLHFPVNHGHGGVAGGTGGATMPTAQLHGVPPVARRRQTSASRSSNMPGMTRSRATGPSSKAM